MQRKLFAAGLAIAALTAAPAAAEETFAITVPIEASDIHPSVTGIGPNCSVFAMVDGRPRAVANGQGEIVTLTAADRASFAREFTLTLDRRANAPAGAAVSFTCAIVMRVDGQSGMRSPVNAANPGRYADVTGLHHAGAPNAFRAVLQDIQQ